MNEEIDETLGLDVKPDFTITDEDSADWYLARVAALHAEEALLRATREAKIKRVVNERKGLEHRFQASLEHWTRQRLEGSRVKSLVLDHGQVCLRKGKSGLQIVDKEAALLFAVEHDKTEALRFAPSLDIGIYERMALYIRDETGELIPGVQIVEEHDEFSIRFPKKGETDATDDTGV